MPESLKTLTVACGQIVCRLADVEHNLSQIEDLAEQAAARGARLMLFPEGALTGYRFDDTVKAVAVTTDGEPARRLLALSRRLDMVIVAGAVTRDGEVYRVSHLVAHPDGRLLLQHKHKLTPSELKNGIVPGAEERQVFEVDGVTYAVCICADSGIEDIWNKLAAKGVQIYMGPTAGGGSRESMVHRDDLADPTRRKEYVANMEKVCFLGPSLITCYRHRMALMACNLAGDDGVSNYHPGHSSIIDSQGRTVGLIPGDYVIENLRPQLICGEIVVQEPVTVTD